MENRGKFASYKYPEVKVRPCVEPYKVLPKFDNVINREMFGLSDTQKGALAENGFVVVPRFHKQLFALYVENKEKVYPSFVTSDLLLHTFHVMYNDIVTRLEKKVFIEDLKVLTDIMLRTSLEQYDSASTSELKEAAERNVCFFAVANSLSGSMELSLPESIAQKVKEEVSLIRNYSSITLSPVFGYSEDYTQYKPRGHYEEDADLTGYFQSMMWFSRMMFRVLPGESGDEKAQRLNETLSTILITLAVKDSKIAGTDAFSLWDEIHSPLSFFIGTGNDFTVNDFLGISKEVFGDSFSIEQLREPENIEKFIAQAQKPGGNVYTDNFRFIGSASIPDSYVFTELVHPAVMERLLPTGLDIMTVLGSKRAGEILNDVYQEFKYRDYGKQLERLKKEFTEYPLITWTQNLYWTWLYCLSALMDEFGDGYPTLMQNKTWQDKELNTVLGSWAELRHDTLLYSKQSEVTKEGMEEPAVDCGYVEPVPEFYARLAGLVNMTWEGLEQRGLFEKLKSGPEPERQGDTNEDWDTYMEKWQKWEQESRYARKEDYQELERIILKLKDLSEKELENKELSEDEYEFIKNIGHDVARLNFYPRDDPTFNLKDMSVIADVHTDSYAREKCLEVASSRGMEIYIAVNIEGSLRIARGAVFSYYEFEKPLDERLTDIEWRELQENERLMPPRPVWTNSFIKGEKDIN
jgi:hypothetical protein